MNANDVQLVRVSTTRTGSAISDQTFAHNQAFQVVVEAEAGATIFGTAGTPYEVRIVVRDLTDNTIIVNPTDANAFVTGFLNDPNWAAQDFSRAFNIPAQGAAKEGHICEAIAHLSVGIGADPNVSFAASPMFIITRP